MKKLILAALCFSLPLGSIADQTTNEGLDFANSQKAYINGLGQGVDSKAAMYGGSGSTSDVDPCNQPDSSGVKHCGGQIVQGQDATQYYGQSPSALQEQGALKAQTDDIGKFVMSSHIERQAMPINRKDPLFKFNDSNKQQMVSLTDTYSGCKQLTLGSEGALTNQTCKQTSKPTLIDVTCHRSWTGFCEWVPSIKYDMVPGSAAKVTGMTRYKIGGAGTISSVASATPLSYYNISATSNYTTSIFYDTVTDDTIYRVEYTRWVADTDNPKTKYLPKLTINGVLVPASSNTLYGCCGKKTYQYKSVWGNIKNYMREGANTVSVNFQGGSVGTHQILNLKETQICNKKFTEAFACEGGRELKNAVLQNTQCDDATSKTYQGVIFNRSCWNQTEIYKSEFTDHQSFTEEEKCNQLRSAGCGLMSTTCDNATCSSSTLNFTCQDGGTQSVSVCGDTLICPDGNCYSGATPANPDNSSNFAQAVTYLEMMKQMKDDLDMNNISVFTGTYLGCDVNKTLIGSNKCCTGGDGTLNDLGISDCSATEMKINQAKKDKRTTLVRTYEKCVQEVLGACIQKRQYYDFCLWPSKLARIVQEKGRAQMSVPITLECNGFKLDDPNELAAINWSTLDLSEYFSDVIGSYNSKPKPTGDQLQNQIINQGPAMTQEYTERMKALYGDSK